MRENRTAVTAEQGSEDARAAAAFSSRMSRHSHLDCRAATVSESSLRTGAARRSGLLAIVCVGETESQRADGDALSICGGQIVASVPTGMTEADLAIGYEPLWAIGSGRMPTSDEIVQMHAHIRKCLVLHLGPHGKTVRILYGGSVNPADAREILALPGVGGALVGGASLKAEDFLAILGSAPFVSSRRLDVA
jgi:triosephosphate isomerase